MKKVLLYGGVFLGIGALVVAIAVPGLTSS
jgi:hypothetical protein